MTEWKPYLPKKSRKALSGCISVGKASIVIAADVSEHYVLKPGFTRILMLWNSKEKMAALKPNNKEGIKVKVNPGNKSIILNCGSFIKHYGIVKRVYTLTAENDMLTFEPDTDKEVEDEEDEEDE